MRRNIKRPIPKGHRKIIFAENQKNTPKSQHWARINSLSVSEKGIAGKSCYPRNLGAFCKHWFTFTPISAQKELNEKQIFKKFSPNSGKRRKE